MVYLAVVAGLAVAGLVPALIAARRGRGFWAWWPYGAVLFVVALPHALLLRPRDEASDYGRRRNCPACGEALPARAVSCRYCGYELSGRFDGFARDGTEASDGRREPLGAKEFGAAAADGPRRPSARAEDHEVPWSDEEFARVSRMGPGVPEERPSDRSVLGIAAAAVAIVSAGALGVAFMPAGAWFGEEQRSSAPEEVVRLPDGIARHVALPDVAVEPHVAVERVPLDPVKRLAPPPAPDIPVMAPPAPPEPQPDVRFPPLPPHKPASRAAGPVEAPGGAEAGDLALVPHSRAARQRDSEPPDAGPALEAPAAEARGAGETGARQASRGVPERATESPPAPSAASPGPVGQGGDIQAVGELVEWLQLRLASFGFYDGPIHGRADAQTRRAIREWQEALDMTPSGNIDHALVVSLRRALPERSALEAR